MGHFIDAAKALRTTLKNALRRPTTVEFPKDVRPRLERFRASFALLHDEHGEELCIGCLQCERICPSQVITIKQGPKRESKVTGKKRGVAEDFVLDLSACIFCELCVQVCPTDAIVMTHSPEKPTTSREDLVLTMAKLYANETEKTRSWGTGTRLMEMQEDPAKEKKAKPAPKAEAPAAAAPAPAAAAPAAEAPAAAPAPAAAAPAAEAPAAPPAPTAEASAAAADPETAKP